MARMGAWPGISPEAQSPRRHGLHGGTAPEGALPEGGSRRRSTCRWRRSGSRSGEGGSMGATGAAAAGHLPVMLDRVLALLRPALEPDGAVLVDATLGRAGHAGALLAEHPALSFVGID